MKLPTFEEYLQDIHARVYTGTDDNMSDSFDTWLTDLQVDYFIRLAQNWGDLVAVEVDTKNVNEYHKLLLHTK